MSSQSKGFTSQCLVRKPAASAVLFTNKEACSYCDIKGSAKLIQCRLCEKWFCNSSSGTQDAHIVHHLKRAGHNQVGFPDRGTLHCDSCGSRNIFVMGFVMIKPENAAVFVCRAPCNQPVKISSFSSRLLEAKNEELWKPIIQACMFPEWLVAAPYRIQKQNAMKITKKQAVRLESLWKVNPESTLQDLILNPVNVEPKLDQVVSIYENGWEYQTIFKPLIVAEREYVVNRKQDIPIRWVHCKNSRVAFFDVNKLESDIELRLNEQLILRYVGKDFPAWESKGSVCQLPKLNNNNEIGLMFPKSINIPTAAKRNFVVECWWARIPNERMQTAVAKFSKGGSGSLLTHHIQETLLGHTVEYTLPFTVELPSNIFAPGLPNLNASQILAAETALINPITLIQGPPGTGKTVTSASIIYHFAQSAKNYGRGPVLVCAPSNVAVDQLAEKVHATGLDVVRVFSKMKENSRSPVERLGLHNLIPMSENQARDPKAYAKIRKKQRARVEMADVICCTCIMALDSRVGPIDYSALLIDESTQCTEPECMVPISLNARQLVLVGDQCQLGPVIQNRRAAQAGLTQTLFERLISVGKAPIVLDTQYRMHPCLSRFPSRCFYKGKLRDGVNASQRACPFLSTSLTWPVKKAPTMFYACFTKEELAATGTSFLNSGEAAFIERLITRLASGGVELDRIGVITPYEGQRAYLTSRLKGSPAYDRLEIQNIDAFQGREKDVIIFSSVRSNDQKNVGFLRDWRRLNVAITRAKFALFIVGNPILLSTDPYFKELITDYTQRRLMVEGNVANLIPYRPKSKTALKTSRPHKKPVKKASAAGASVTNTPNAKVKITSQQNNQVTLLPAKRSTPKAAKPFVSVNEKLPSPVKKASAAGASVTNTPSAKVKITSQQNNQVTLLPAKRSTPKAAKPFVSGMGPGVVEDRKLSQQSKQSPYKFPVVPVVQKREPKPISPAKTSTVPTKKNDWIIGMVPEDFAHDPFLCQPSYGMLDFATAASYVDNVGVNVRELEKPVSSRKVSDSRGFNPDEQEILQSSAPSGSKLSTEIAVALLCETLSQLNCSTH